MANPANDSRLKTNLGKNNIASQLSGTALNFQNHDLNVVS